MLLCRGRLRLTGWQASPRFTHALAVHAGPNQLIEVASGAGSGRSRRTHPPAAKKNRRCATRRAVDIRCTTHHSITYHHHHHHHHHCNHHCHSTTTAMLAMYDTWVEAAEHGKIAGVTMIDMSAAFDVVDSSILLAKARLYGVTRDTERR